MKLYQGSLLLIVGLAAVSSAPAQDFYGAGVSARTAGRSGVYVPGSEGVGDALALNPAGLAWLSSTQVDLSLSAMAARGSFSNASNVDSPMRRTAGLVPFGAVGVPIGKRWTVAGGFVPDLLSSAKWQFRDTPGAAGANYGPQHEKSEILAFRTTAGVSFRVNSRVSLGMTLGSVYNSNTLEMPYVFQSHPALRSLKTGLQLHTTGRGWMTSYGVVAYPSRRWMVSAAYRTGASIASTGKATGNIGAQLSALGIPFQPDFAYRAQVQVDLPRTAQVGVSWQKSSTLRFGFQTGWTGWKSAFNTLPVSLSNGSNRDINGFLASSSLVDTVPVGWKDQFTFSGFAEKQLGETISLSGGWSHRTNPVPSSTLSPMTAAIMKNGFATGLGWKRSRVRFDLGYQFNFGAEQSVGKSQLAGGEFNGSRVRVGTQALTLTTSFRP